MAHIWPLCVWVVAGVGVAGPRHPWESPHATSRDFPHATSGDSGRLMQRIAS
jgi:hypothetical protein